MQSPSVCCIKAERSPPSESDYDMLIYQNVDCATVEFYDENKILQMLAVNNLYRHKIRVKILT